MKFSVKIVFGTMMIIVIMFSLSGIILIHENFKNSFNHQMKANIDEHFLEKYSIETNIYENMSEDGIIDYQKLMKYLYSLTSYLENSRKLAIYAEGDKIWDNIPFVLDDERKEGGMIRTYEGKQYSIIRSEAEINGIGIEVVSVFDISDLFEVRDQNLLRFYIIEGILLILCGCLIALFVRVLTAPIKKLNEITKAVANGNLEESVNINTNDEVGELAKSFDTMVESIKNRQEELAFSLKQREDFIANFTHELKTPMTSIMGYTKILKQDRYSQKDKEKALDYIYSETKRLEILSHKLLDLLSLTEDQIILKKLNASKLLNDAEELAKNRFENVNLSSEAEETEVMGDEALLMTCLMNLVENAVKASEKAEEIKITGKISGNKYRVSVIDHGIGIKAGEISRVTESFYMADKARSKSKGGYGLGLSLVSKIVKLHHSELMIESEAGIGTTISFDLEVVNNEKKP